MKKYIKYWPLAIVLLLLLTNPTVKDFKDYRGSNTYLGLRRSGNYFLFSEYREHGTTYLGFLWNFVRVEPYYRNNIVVNENNLGQSDKMDTTKYEHVSSTNKDPLGLLTPKKH